MSFATYGYHGEIHECFPTARRFAYCVAENTAKEQCAAERQAYLECWRRNKKQRADHVLSRKVAQEVLSVPAYHVPSDSVVAKDEFPSLRRVRPEHPSK